VSELVAAAAAATAARKAVEDAAGARAREARGHSSSLSSGASAPGQPSRTQQLPSSSSSSSSSSALFVDGNAVDLIQAAGALRAMDRDLLAATEEAVARVAGRAGGTGAVRVAPSGRAAAFAAQAPYVSPSTSFGDASAGESSLPSHDDDGGSGASSLAGLDLGQSAGLGQSDVLSGRVGGGEVVIEHLPPVRDSIARLDRPHK
jgi:hypothetical protein